MTRSRNVDVAFRFVEAINRLDLDALTDLMTDDHVFVDLSGGRHVGKVTMRDGWREYMTSFPEYMIHVSEVHEVGDTVFLVGRTTGSHLRLPREVEFRESIIWAAKIREGRVAEWRLYDDTPEVRSDLDVPVRPLSVAGEAAKNGGEVSGQ
jgi:ketosteroid isomerase-like protein